MTDIKLDIDKLTRALDNTENNGIDNLNYETIEKQKNTIIEKLFLSDEKTASLKRSLKQYRYIDELHELKYGAYIRYINLNNTNNLHLNKGGFIYCIEIEENGIHIRCRSGYKKCFFEIKFDEVLIFQKITEQEKTILDVLELLNS